LTILESVDRSGRAASLLSIMASALALVAVSARVVGWLWSTSRGDWQAVLLSTYWLATPFLCGISLALTHPSGSAGGRGLKRVNRSLLGLWGAVSLYALLFPFLSR
jgi:hypothetical protein